MASAALREVSDGAHRDWTPPAPAPADAVTPVPRYAAAAAVDPGTTLTEGINGGRGLGKVSNFGVRSPVRLGVRLTPLARIDERGNTPGVIVAIL